MFPNEDSCWKWLEYVRGHGKPPPGKPHRWWCKPCRKQFTATRGTVMHSRCRPLKDWIYTIYSVLTARKGVSAMQVSKELDCYFRTTWYMLHRVWEACGRDGLFKLKGVVEVDETCIGGKRAAMSNKKRKELFGTGRGAVGKIPVIGLGERDGRLKAIPLPADTPINKELMADLVKEHVEDGASVYTDEHGSYAGLAEAKFQHESVNHSPHEYANELAHLNGVESVRERLKHSIHGTWHHVSPKHLQRYVNEAVFRLNQGSFEMGTIDRMRALTSRLLDDGRLPIGKVIEHNGLSHHVQAVQRACELSICLAGAVAIKLKLQPSTD